MSQFLCPMIKKTDLSFDPYFRQVLLQVPLKGEVNLLDISLKKVIIYQDYLPFLGDPVQLTDNRFQWKGMIIENKGDRVLVNWGGSQRWHAPHELCLLTGVEVNIFQVARCGRESIIKKQALTKLPQAHSNDESIFNSSG